ncbi:hypothetical protein CDCA_CDCA05G1577 [Cyanidium caldarium]|uniref:Uncharacterized protein n=1 Tax=Cyanidium caldarium TaxID=2771 RepID=A0AAV9ITG8_CYACA|nr:hypothetical protein CDCA_CDCA05G1577 [Cyanidium caldarium]
MGSAAGAFVSVVGTRHWGGGRARHRDGGRHGEAAVSARGRCAVSRPLPRRLRGMARRWVRCAQQQEQQQQREPSPNPPSTAATGDGGFRLRTRGDVVLFLVFGSMAPFAVYALLRQLPMLDDISAGLWTTGLLMVAVFGWVATYLFRVGTKSMTYAQQLRAYEDVVLQKRLSELNEEELAALLEEEEGQEQKEK